MSRLIAAFSQYFDGAGNPLSSGWLHFLESGSTSTDKDTFADSGESVPNANPVQLDSEGRCPNVFGSGTYRAILYSNDPATNTPLSQIEWFDPVGGIVGSGDFDDWSSSGSYSEGDIVKVGALTYYRSMINDNVNFEPSVNPVYWEKIAFTRYWNSNVTYTQYSVVILESTGGQYISLSDDNLGNDPASSPSDWNKQEGLENVVEDLAPKAGGDFEMLTHDLILASGDILANDNQLVEAILKDTGELSQDLGSLSANTAISLASGNACKFTVAGDFTLSVTGWKAANILNGLLMKITNGTAFTITWPSIVWDTGSLPELQASGVDWVLLWTEDNSSIVYGKRVWQEV